MFIYLKELQNRLVLISVSFFALCVVCYRFKEALLYSIICNTKLCYYSNYFSYFIFTHANEVLYVYFKLIFFVALQPIHFIILWQVFGFVSPGLFYREFLLCRIFLVLMTVTWGVGLAVINAFIFPIFTSFVLNFHSFSGFYTVQLFFEPKLIESLDFYVSFVNNLTLHVALVNIICFFLTLLDFDLSAPRRFRKTVFYSGLFFLIFFVPLEPFIQLFAILLIVIFYESWLLFFLLNSAFIED